VRRLCNGRLAPLSLFQPRPWREARAIRGRIVTVPRRGLTPVCGVW
jgi:hypothetical protein